MEEIIECHSVRGPVLWLAASHNLLITAPEAVRSAPIVDVAARVAPFLTPRQLFGVDFNPLPSQTATVLASPKS